MPWPRYEDIQEAPAGTNRCSSCHIAGHCDDECRIFDIQLYERLGKFSLKPFDIAKRPIAYADKLLTYLKHHGALTHVWQPWEWEHFQGLVDEKRRIVDEERAAERAAGGDAWRGNTN
jgi:hypothetical protein